MGFDFGFSCFAWGLGLLVITFGCFEFGCLPVVSGVVFSVGCLVFFAVELVFCLVALVVFR